jgi:hypothetical protein
MSGSRLALVVLQSMYDWSQLGSTGDMAMAASVVQIDVD